MGNLKALFSTLFISPMLLAPSVTAVPVPASILIVELQVRGDAVTGPADHEFIELFNMTDQPIDVSSWKLQYKSATGSSWSDKATLHGSLSPGGRYLLVSDKYPNPPTADPDLPALALTTFSAGLSDSGGHVRIVDAVVSAVPVVHDLLGWGTSANAAEGEAPAAAPGGGKSLKRVLDSEGAFIDTNNNRADFEVSSDPTPVADPLYQAPISDPDPLPEIAPGPLPSSPTDEIIPPAPDEITQVPTPIPETEQEVVTVPILPPVITELLPNPAAPASDSTDEFIELYNPNDVALPLDGYKLQSGTTYSYSHTFNDVSLMPREYRAFMVTATGNILSNSGGQARLLAADGTVLAQTNAYAEAEEDQSWSLFSGAWQWTSTPTPNGENILTLPIKHVGVVKAPSTKKTSAKQAAAKKTTAASTKTSKPKVAAAKKTAAKASKPKALAVERQVYQEPEEAPASLHPGILAGVGAITLLYACYEYRNDAVNSIRRFKRYREIRRAARASTSGR